MKILKPVTILKIALIAGLFVLFQPQAAFASIADDIAAKNKQIEELQRQIAAYQAQIDQNHDKARTLESEINKLNAVINQVTLEIKSLGFSIDQASLQIRDTVDKIGEAETKLQKHKEALGEYLRITYETDQKSLTEILLDHGTLSDFFNNLNSLKSTQDHLRVAIDDIQDLKTTLDSKKDELEDRKTDLEKLRSLQEIEKRALDGNKSQKNKILKDTKGEESKFQELVKKSQLDINRIRDQVYYLERNGVTAEDAVKYGELAARRAGIRPAFLIAILEIESGLGRNVGTGNWMDDMVNCYLRLGKPSRAQAEKDAFLKIVEMLGLDPASVKVSREPNYGCGGAMGPAQFIPTTWLSYIDRVTQVTGRATANPWNIEDAFTASALKLAAGGATSKDRAGEDGAARAYIGGSRSCKSAACNSYSAAVLRKAAQIEPNLNP
jgi:membrane-bound lytic murein transglycosylase B/uncharacterized protein YoxC